MATANPVPHDSSIADRSIADLVVFVAAMSPEEFKGVLMNLERTFSAETTVVATQNELPADAATRLRITMLPKSNPV